MSSKFLIWKSERQTRFKTLSPEEFRREMMTGSQCFAYDPEPFGLELDQLSLELGVGDKCLARIVAILGSLLVGIAIGAALMRAP